MFMFDRIREWRRQRVADRVVANGEVIRHLRATRSGIDGDLWPLDVADLDSEIERRERRQRALLEYLKQTA